MRVDRPLLGRALAVVLAAIAALALLAAPGQASAPPGVTDNGDGTFTLRQRQEEIVSGADTGWTSVYSAFPTTGHWNGAGLADGRARAGFQDWTEPAIARSFFQFDVSRLGKARVLRAELTLFGAHSATCAGSAVSLRSTGPVDASTTWNTQPAVYSARTTYESGFCGGGRWIGFDVTGEVAEAAGRGPTATFGLTAADERDRYAYRAYGTGATGQAPVLTITFEIPEGTR
ncbi:DNRLRE domain-containing protein [Nonomuraea sp. NPDC050783]|uniref:DNRLRE domain-containing protein n=1 Tax=Nonomuraea sp. NPDC050783 TaxID=3154634 RepID=UPI0034668975